jgi:hypothetical protein
MQQQTIKQGKFFPFPLFTFIYAFPNGFGFRPAILISLLYLVEKNLKKVEKSSCIPNGFMR